MRALSDLDAAKKRERLAAWDLYPIVDLKPENCERCGLAVDQMIAGGARVIQLRIKGASTARIAETARGVIAPCRAAGVALIVNDDAEACRDADADGLHLGQGDLSPSVARRVIGPERILGLSTHSRAQFTAGLREPVDYLAVGPVFDTVNKANPDPTVGLELVRWAKSQADRPVIAIGGINSMNIRSVIDAGADAVAVIGAVMKSSDIAAAVRSMRAVWI
jgi:thiamine-phosphate pyrophosphorylase